MSIDTSRQPRRGRQGWRLSAALRLHWDAGQHVAYRRQSRRRRRAAILPRLADDRRRRLAILIFSSPSPRDLGDRWCIRSSPPAPASSGAMRRERATYAILAPAQPLPKIGFFITSTVIVFIRISLRLALTQNARKIAMMVDENYHPRSLKHVRRNSSPCLEPGHSG